MTASAALSGSSTAESRLSLLWGWGNSYYFFAPKRRKEGRKEGRRCKLSVTLAYILSESFAIGFLPPSLSSPQFVEWENWSHSRSTKSLL